MSVAPPNVTWLKQCHSNAINIICKGRDFLRFGVLYVPDTLGSSAMQRPYDKSTI